MKKAFTLIELLIVVGILAILAAVLISKFGGAYESARATKCLANMRALAQAANSLALTQGWYPMAGNQIAESEDDNESASVSSAEQLGWIGTPGTANDQKKQVKPIAFYASGNSDLNALTALTNGTLYKATNNNREIYTCPTHIRYRKDHNRTKPTWSYVMNGYFKYDTTHGTGASGNDQSAGAGGPAYLEVTRKDRRIMFAELPVQNDKLGTKDPEDSGDVWQCDCTLAYYARNCGKWGEFGKEKIGTPEQIGFVHKGNRGWLAHVVFCDGHTEKLIYPLKKGGQSIENLTAMLCAARDYSYANGVYGVADGADEKGSGDDEDEE